MKIKKLWKPPEDLGKHGRKMWMRVGTLLVDAGELDELDKESF
jgi:phage terminase small subunit